MNIYVLDPEDLTLLAVINDYSARSWIKVWSESGQFTIWAPATPENKEFLVEENLIWPDDQNCVGVIEYIHKYTSEDAGPTIEVSGRFVESSYLSRRIIWGNALITASPATVIAILVQDHATSPGDTDRSFGSIVDGEVSILPSVPSQPAIDYCNSYGNLWEEVKSLSIEHGLHLEFQYQTGILIGMILAGQDKSNEVNLSTDLGFLTDSDYQWNSTDYCNTALIAGEGEGAARTKAYIIPSALGKDRRELFVDARDLQKTSASAQNPMSDEEYTKVLVQRGQKKLLEYPLYESYDCSLQITGEEGYIFGKDYNLGDTVTLTDTVLGVQVNAIVKEHQIDEDKDGRVDTLVFGISIPTITSLVKRRN